MNEKRDQEKLIELGAHFKKIRESLNLSQDELAARCDLNKDKISKIENGKKDFYFTSFLEFARGLGLHPKKMLDKNFEFLKDE
jgi:cytoskeletal protein RodZ